MYACMYSMCAYTKYPGFHSTHLLKVEKFISFKVLLSAVFQVFQENKNYMAMELLFVLNVEHKFKYL